MVTYNILRRVAIEQIRLLVIWIIYELLRLGYCNRNLNDVFWGFESWVLKNGTKYNHILLRYYNTGSMLLFHREPPPLQTHNNSNIILRLPGGKRIKDIKWLSVWCRRFTVSKTYWISFFTPFSRTNAHAQSHT